MADPTPRERAIARIGLAQVLRLEEGGLRVVDRHPDLHDVLVYEAGVKSGRLEARKEAERLRLAAEAVVRASAMPGNRNGLAALIKAIEALRDALATTITEGGER